MRIPAFFRSVTATLILISATTVTHAGLRQDARLITATEVLEELLEVPDQNVPAYLLERAYGIAVIPDVIKAGFVAAGRRGKGVLVVRQKDGTWSNPLFINLTGGSFGFQAGVQSADVLLVFATQNSIEGIVGGKVTLGADAAVAAGPVGRQTSAATDIGLAQVFSYSRARGLFAGLALDGSALTIDRSSNEEFYSTPGLLASDIIAPGATPAPEPANRFIAAIERAVASSSTAAPTVASQTFTESTATEPAATPAQGQERTESAQTFPIEDPAPGAEPPR